MFIEKEIKGELIWIPISEPLYFRYTLYIFMNMRTIIPLMGVTLTGVYVAWKPFHIPENWWKTTRCEDIVYETTDEEKGSELQYSFQKTYNVSSEGVLTVEVYKERYDVLYEIQTVTAIEQQRFLLFSRTIERPLGTQKKEKERSLEEYTLASDIPVLFSSNFFTFNDSEEYEQKVMTNNTGTASVTLVPEDHNFVFSLEYLADTDVAEQINEFGLPESTVQDLLVLYAQQESFAVIAKTQAEQGMNLKNILPVHGYMLKEKSVRDILGFQEKAE